MALKIRTTGIEDYLDGSSNIKMLVLGDPSVGKTRSASFWPKPIFADIEAGRASIADRNVPYAEIHSSQEMLEFLEYLKHEALKQPDKSKRAFQTVVIDTIDGFSRKVQDEWLQANKKSTFTGYDAWGYLDAKLQALLTRLLNLDYNVIINVHYKEKGGEDDGGRRLVLQLKGDVKDTIFNDFDLVGYMGTYWESEGGERVEKRGLTFHKTPDKMVLKDRFGVMPRWLPITFAETDYTQIRDALATRLDSLTTSEEVGEVPAMADPATIPSNGVVAPAEAGGGALPAQEAREMPLDKLDKPTLGKIARDLGLIVKGNALKSEIVKAIEAKRAEDAAKPATPVAEPAATSTAPVAEASVNEASEVSAPVTEAVVATPEPAAEADAAPASPTDGCEAEHSPADANCEMAPTETEAVVTADGETATVDTATGEIVADLAASLGATVVEETTTEPEATPEPAAQRTESAAEVVASPSCGVCGKSLAGENQDYVKLSSIKYRKKLCNDGYVKAKALAVTPLPADFTCR